MDFYLGRKNENYWNSPMDEYEREDDTIDYEGDYGQTEEWVGDFEDMDQTQNVDQPEEEPVGNVVLVRGNLVANVNTTRAVERSNGSIVNIVGDDRFNSILQQSIDFRLENNRRFTSEGMSDGEIVIRFLIYEGNNDITFLYAYLEDFMNHQTIGFERKEMTITSQNDNSTMNITGLYIKNFSFNNSLDYLNVDITFGYERYTITFQ